jgi:PPP family 3-phenylpropionic acid transporter
MPGCSGRRRCRCCASPLTAALGAQLVVLVLAQALHAADLRRPACGLHRAHRRHFPGALRGRGQALYTVLGYGVSGVVGGLAGGWLSTQFGIRAVFWAAVGAAALGWWCALRSGRADRIARPAPP